MSVVDWFRRFFERSVVPREPVTLRAVAVVRNGVREPRMGGWQDVRSDIIVRQDLEPALDGIDSYSHLIVLFYMQQVPEQEKERTHVHPRGALAVLQGCPGHPSPLRPTPRRGGVPWWRRNILRVRLTLMDAGPGPQALPSPLTASDPMPEWATKPPEEP
jgi:hypothetical protein